MDIMGKIRAENKRKEESGMLDIQNVSISFGAEQAAVSDVSFTVEEKDKMVVIGETGSGKSVLLLAILGLLPEIAVIKGDILFHEKSLLSMKKKELRTIRGAKISYIPQGSGNGLNPLLQVKTQVVEAMRCHQKMKRNEAKEYVGKFLRKFGFEESERVAKSYPFMLSGGMRQRVLISMGIAADAEMILADEPTKGLDADRIAMVVEAFSKLKDRTLLCVTHDLRFAKEVATKISVMYASQQIEICDSTDFFTNPLHPYSCAMLKALPENGLHANMGFAPPKANDKMRLGCHFKERCPYQKERCWTETPPLITVKNRKVRCWKYAD